MLTPQTLQVHILDFSKANNQLTESLNKLNSTNKKYYFGAQYCGLIDVNNRYILVTPDAFYWVPQINDIKSPQVLFQLDFFEEIDNGLMLVPEGTANLTIADIEMLKVRQSTLCEFMRENFNATTEIYHRIKELLNYVNSPSSKNIYELS